MQTIITVTVKQGQNGTKIAQAYDGLFGFELTSWNDNWFQLESNTETEEEAKNDLFELESELSDDQRVQDYTKK